MNTHVEAAGITRTRRGTRNHQAGNDTGVQRMETANRGPVGTPQRTLWTLFCVPERDCHWKNFLLDGKSSPNKDRGPGRAKEGPQGNRSPNILVTNGFFPENETLKPEAG